MLVVLDVDSSGEPVEVPAPESPLLLLISLAHAGELNFSPDRPGIGDSTTSVGGGAVMIEGGVQAIVDPTAVGTSGVVGRIGLSKTLEARVRAPDFVLFDDGVMVGPVGLGTKVGGHLDEHWSLSFVPEVYVQPGGGSVGANLGTNLAYGLDNVGLWLHATTTVSEAGTTGFFGGGASCGFDALGVYVNGGRGFNGDPVVGGGGWIPLSATAQLDFGCDLTLDGGTARPAFLLGTSLGFD